MRIVTRLLVCRSNTVNLASVYPQFCLLKDDLIVTLSSAARSTNTDAYNWIGVSGGTWEGLGNWADTSSGTNPASFVSGTLTPATIVGPTGSTVEVIVGGGVASSLTLTGSVGLGGTYTVGNALTIGSLVPPLSSFTSATYTVGSLSLSTGAIAAGSVNVLDGTLALGSGTGLSASSITAGNTSSNNGFYNVNSASSTIGLVSNATLSATGALSLANAILNDAGGAVTIGGTLTIGAAQSVGTAPYSFFNASSGQINVSAGGTVTAAAINEIYGAISVSGTGSKLVVSGTLTANVGNYAAFSSSAGALSAVSGGSAQVGGIVLSANGKYGFSQPNLSVDTLSTIEVGTTGGTAAGSITVDVGKSIAVGTTASFTGVLIDNGTVNVTAGATLTQNGAVSGSGALQIGKNSTLQLNGAAAATDTIAFQDVGAALSIGNTPVLGTGFFFGTGSVSTPYAINATITGFQTGDSITLAQPVTTATFTQATGTLVLANGTTTVEALHITGDFTGKSFSLSPTTNNGAAVSLITTATTQQGPKIVNSSDGTSSSYAPNPTPTVTQTITRYSGAGGLGSVLSNIVDNADSTSLLYAYNPTSTVKQTTSKYSGTDSSNGAPSGTKISDVIDNTDGTSLVYAYNPSTTVKQVTTKFSATDPSNGAPAGTRISDVVDNTDGTSLVYAYNPSGTVKQVTSKYSGTDPSNGAPTGAQISAVVDNTDGTALVYAYNPTSNITLTAILYSGTDPANGAPTGSQVTEVFDYVSGQSSVQTFNADGSSATLYYAGLDGAGGQIPALSPFTLTASAASTIGDFTSMVKEAGITPGTGSLSGSFSGGVITTNNNTSYSFVSAEQSSSGAYNQLVSNPVLSFVLADPSTALIKSL